MSRYTFLIFSTSALRAGQQHAHRKAHGARKAKRKQPSSGTAGASTRRQQQSAVPISLLSSSSSFFFFSAVGYGGEGEERRPPERRRTAVLTPPLSLEGGLAAELRVPNVLQRVLSLFKSVLPGSDLTHFQLPPLFNMPKSQLQCQGEDVYCIAEDTLGKCAKGKTSLERMTSVVAWMISTRRPAVFGLAPFNPILGETHHVSKGTMNFLMEQVSHHPPVSALHATDEEENIELSWCHHIAPKFYGSRVEVLIHGKKLLKLLRFGECYEMDTPSLVIRALPVPGTEWEGSISISCKESGLQADLCFYKAHSFLGFGGDPRSVKGKIFDTKTLRTIYEIYGQWDRTVMLKDAHSGEVTVLYNAQEAIFKLNTPTVKDPEGLLPTESAMVWAEVSEAILNRDWDKAREAKRSIEERERRLRRERSVRGEAWVPKFFTLAQAKDGGWECWSKHKVVPQAPIISHTTRLSRVVAKNNGRKQVKAKRLRRAPQRRSLRLPRRIISISDCRGIHCETSRRIHEGTKRWRQRGVNEGEKRREPPMAVLSPPLSLEGGLAAVHRAPNLMQSTLSLFKNVRPGSNLAHFQLPPLFNMPKSQLQCYGESIYCIAEDILGKCAKGESSLERFTCVVAWNLSTIRPPVFGLAPFNPILGETHHSSRGTLNVLLEQVSHHPPVTALHATDAEGNVEILWCQSLAPGFNGTGIEAPILGKRQLKLLKLGECYEMDAPSLMIRLLPVPSIEWAGNISIRCKESGLAADLCLHKAHSFLGFGGDPRSVKGRIFNSKTLMTIYEIYGQWDRTVMLKDVESGKVTVLYSAKEAISKLKTPVVKDPEGLSPTESAVVWAEVSQAIVNRGWDRAREAKTGVEERERRLRRERSAKGETWEPKHFIGLAQTKDGVWECRPKHKVVPQAPIVKKWTSGDWEETTATSTLPVTAMVVASASSLLPPLSSRQTTKTPIPQRRPSNPSWVSLPPPHRAVAVAVSSQQAVSAPNELVDDILSKVKGTDRGVLLTREGHAEVGGLAEELSKYCVEEPVKNPLIFGEWDVMYCSNPTSPGGGYRSAVGRLIFKTTEMVQAVEAPDSVRNRVSFSAFGFLDGEVSLKGKLNVLSDKWIQVIFEPPELKIGAFDFRYGGESEVKLEITYVDENIRLGKGSRGSLFVFRRRG
ncbi:hypothetical protein Taro_017697 [Colocasia esculenta]|uniref:Plastid lipid-associated protein/fibrillin conserved domain-containing protein n=1 Tax=Colocasia esculenta TaxID=4460 RepID=A0A843UNU0_COLES|nr:hypothetical protein [Colocasia esculenta]